MQHFKYTIETSDGTFQCAVSATMSNGDFVEITSKNKIENDIDPWTACEVEFNRLLDNLKVLADAIDLD